MNKTLSISATSFTVRLTQILIPALLLVFICAGPSRADARSTALQQQFMTSLNTMVQYVQAAPSPSAKREIIGNFLNRMDHGMGMARAVLSEKDRRALDVMQAKVEAQYAELNGLQGSPKVADAELNHYAQYLQQNMEQAQAAYWGGGGVYLSVGALIIILILILILA